MAYVSSRGRHGCDVRRVHDDLAILLEIKIVEKNEERKLICPYVVIRIDMHTVAAD